ncbi:hypothetical protein GCM10007928_49210 [Sulfitobacter porphyrae]|nr:hypothetical protein GCM10007928_49210 [Sulfitobacter porphyrae]
MAAPFGQIHQKRHDHGKAQYPHKEADNITDRAQIHHAAALASGTGGVKQSTPRT